MDHESFVQEIRLGTSVETIKREVTMKIIQTILKTIEKAGIRKNLLVGDPVDSHLTRQQEEERVLLHLLEMRFQMKKIDRSKVRLQL